VIVLSSGVIVFGQIVQLQRDMTQVGSSIRNAVCVAFQRSSIGASDHEGLIPQDRSAGCVALSANVIVIGADNAVGLRVLREQGAFAVVGKYAGDALQKMVCLCLSS
jgi:hypothetical protein